MSKGNIIVLLIAGIIGGGFLGWAIAAAAGQGNAGQSTSTGIGSLVGLIVCGVFAAVSASSRKP